MGIVPEEINYYKDKQGRCCIRVINETSNLIPSIDFYEDEDRTLVSVNNRKIIDHKKGNSFLQYLLQPKQEVVKTESPTHIEHKRIKQIPNEKTLEIENKQEVSKW